MSETQLRHMSQSDAFTWYMERDPLLRSTAIVVMMFDRAPDHARVLARLERASRIVPGLRHCLVEPPWRVATPVWTVDPDFDLSWHVRRIAVAAPATLASVLDFARTEGMGSFDVARPLWTWTTVEGLEGGRAAGVLKIHHSLTDGIGGVELANQLMDFERDAPDPQDNPNAPIAHPLGSAGLLLDGMRFQGLRLGRAARDAVAGAPRRTARVLRRPVAVANDVWSTAGSIYRTVRPITDTRSTVMTRRRLTWHYAVFDLPLDDLKRAGKAAGGSLNDAFLAGIACGLERYHESYGAKPESLRVTMPISVRVASDPPGGNRITLMRFDVPTAPCTAVERMHLIHARADASRREPAIPLTNTIAEVLNLLPTSVVGGMLKHVDFLASNVPGLDVPFYLGGAQVLQIYPFGPTIGAALNVTLISYGATCHLGVNCDTGAVLDPDRLVESLHEGFDDVLAAGRDPATR